MSDAIDDSQLLRVAIAHHNAGQLAEAETIYRQILSRDPNHSDALHLLGVLAGQGGQPQIAVELISKAIAIKPDKPLYYQSLAEIHRQMGMPEPALASLRRALELDPDSPIALDRMGNIEREMGRLDAALAVFERYARLRPDSPEGHNNIGVCLKELGRPHEAVVAYRRAIQLKPDFAEAHNNLGVCLKEQGNVDEAIDQYRQAVGFRPDFAEAHNNLGAALLAAGSADQAVAEFRKAIEIRPDFGGAHYNLSLALLLLGEFSDGWREHEWRWQAKGFPSARHQFGKPQWDGGDLAGRTILLHCEQGFGDSIQFIRYACPVAERGAKIILWTPRELVRLFQGIEVISTVISAGDCPPIDLHCPLMTLPRIFDTRRESIPAWIPYLQSDPNLAERWKQKVGGGDGVFRIGLAWAGRPMRGDDRGRSISLQGFAGLTATGRGIFYSLQKGEAGAQSANPPPGMKLIDWTADIHDFADTAALIANLDLVITVDSAVAHLAGEMGKPVWVLLPFAPDWRWLLDREDSPWYPTMRLFRQPTRGDWNMPMARMREMLHRAVT
jgi:tetratricopeptide (TPR) repeat protein